MRFNTITDCWTEIEISTLIKEVNIKTSDFITHPLYSFTIEDGVTPKTDRYERSFLVKKDGELFKVIKKDHFIMNPMNLRFGAINFSKIVKPVSVSGYYDIFIIDDCIYNYFWNAYFKNNKTLYRYNQIATGSLEEKKRVYFNQFIKMKFKVPSNDEKCKINNLISLIEDRIITQKKIIEDLIELKKGIINSTFNKYKYYKKIKLSMVLKERKKYAIKESNIIHATLSKEGIFPKTDRYNRDFLVKDEEKNYKISLLNDICYNPANLKFGVITRNKYGKCIISPIYVTYEVDDKFLPDFVELYVCQNSFINYIRKYEQGTVYERMAVNSEDFLKGEIPFLSYEIQSSLVNKIKLIEEKIQNEKSILQLYIKEKEYFLNSLFI